MSGEMQNTSGTLREKGTILFMLIAIFLSLFSGIETWFKSKIAASEARLETSRKEILHRIAARTESGIFLTRKLLPLLRQIVEKKGNCDKIRIDFQKRYGFDLSIYRFSKTAKFISSSPSRAPNLWLMKNLFPALAEKDVKKLPALARKLNKKIQFAFGYGKDITSFRENSERKIETAFDGKAGLLAWTARENGGVIIYCPEVPEQNHIFRKEVLQLRKIGRIEKAGIIKERIGTANTNLASKAYQELIRQTKDYGNFAGKSWLFLKTFSGKIFFACFRLENNPFKRILHLTRLLLVTAGLIFLFFLMFSSSALSLKILLIGMFFAASLIPLSGIVIMTIDNLDVYEQIETNKIRAAQEETLGNIAQNFTAYLASCSVTLLKLTESPGTGPTSKDTLKMKEATLAMFPDAKITIRNSGSEKLFYHGPMVSQGRASVFKSLGRKLIERYSPDRLNEHEYSGNAFSDSMVNKDDMGFSTLLNYPNMLQIVSTGNAELVLFYRLIPASAGDCAIVQVELSTYQTIKRYLESLSSKRFGIDNNFLHISAFYPAGYRWSLPPTLEQEQHFLRLAENAWVSDRPQFKRFSEQLNGFALGLKTQALSGNCLVAFCSDEQLEKALKQKKQRIALGVLIGIILLASIAIWISRQLISPLEFLGIGVKALSSRKFETRLPEPPGKDEIANLFVAFNEMMAESYDMQIAKNVQEGLIPQKFPDLPPYSMHGILREASELGGDCLDCFMVDEKKLLFLIGDITGHGVGSALIMAFARAVTFHWSQSKETSPITLADQLDKMLRNNKTSRMFMGIICGILDLEKETIELVVKGHIYPLLIRKDGTKQWVGSPAYPLGIGKVSPAKSIHISFGAGDRILCMTDGIVEARSADKPLGFDGIEKWADQSFSPDAMQWISNLEKLYSLWSPDVQNDDISIFALCNNSEKKE